MQPIVNTAAAALNKCRLEAMEPRETGKRRRGKGWESCEQVCLVIWPIRGDVSVFDTIPGHELVHILAEQTQEKGKHK